MSEPLKAIFVEDSVDDVELLVHTLHRGGYQLDYRRVQTAADLRLALKSGSWDMVFSDYSMPGFNALQALQIVREHGDVPFLIVSGTIGEETAVQAMKAGANDYLMKGSLARLLPSVDRELREVANKRLRQQLQDQLARVGRLEALGKLASGIAHDFNNLLMVIAGSSELMLEMITDKDPLREEIEEILKATRHGTALTAQLLSFSRKQTLTPRPVQLNEVIGSLEKMLKRVLGSSIRLETELEPELARTRLDPNQFEQVLMNLTVNARDAMPQGGVLRIRTENAEDVNHQPVVRLTVTDTGTGMDPETLSRLFEPFYSTKGPGRGTGLGLSTVYGVVTQSGGLIEVDSTLGAGSTFRLDFPSLPTEERAVVPTGNCIVLIEDEPAVRRVVQRILMHAGYELLPAGCAQEARELLTSHADRIQLVISDVCLPDANGIEFIQEILGTYAGLRFLLISGSRHSLELVGPVGEAVKTLEKPFLPEELLEAVASSLPRA